MPQEMKGSEVCMEATEPRKPRDMGTIAWVCVVVSLLSSIFLFALDNTIVADVQPRIIETFGNIDKLPWISVAFALGGIAVNLFVSKLFGQFDNKLLFIAGVILFEAGSAICGAAPNITALIIGRTVCGIGGAGIYVGAINLLSALTSEVERPVYLSYVGLTWGLGTVLGPIIGGLFADNSPTWRWSFYINLCIGAVFGPIYIFLLPSHNPRPGISILSRIYQLDFLGALLNAGAFTTLIMAIAFGGGAYTWNSGQIIGLFICSGILWIAFICQQGFTIFTSKENRLFPVAFLKSRDLDILFAQIAIGVVEIFIPIYFIPLYFQFVKNESALSAGVHLLPFIVFEVFGVVFSGVMMSKLGYYMPWYLIGGILSLIGGVLLHTVGMDTSSGQIYGYSIILGLGAGLYVQSSYPVAQGKVDPTEVPLAVAFIGCGQITGITLALSISNTIFLNEATNKIARILPHVPRSVVQEAISGARNSFFMQLDRQDQTQVLSAVVKSIANIYYMVIAGAVVTIVLSCFMSREKIFTLQPISTSETVLNEKEKDHNDGQLGA